MVKVRFLLREQVCHRAVLMAGTLFLSSMILNIPWNSTPAVAKACVPAVPVGHGNATSEEKAKRNARISLKAQLERDYPGDSKRFLAGGVAYKCSKSVLWMCTAITKTCG